MVNKKTEKEILFSTPILKTLDFLLSHPNREYSDADICRNRLGIKRSAVSYALNTLSSIGLVERRKNGKTRANSLIGQRPIVPFLKIVSNLLEIEPIVKKCQELTYKITLFGSRADGTNDSESDFDIFAITNDKTKIIKILQNSRLSVQPILKLPEEAMNLSEEEPTLWNAISKGIILWEKM